MNWKPKGPPAGVIPHDEFYRKTKDGSFTPVIVFYGKEELLIARAEAYVKNAVLGKSVTDFNYELVYCEKGMGPHLAEAAATPPFGAGRKLVVARGAQELKDDDYDAIATYAARPFSGTVLLMLYPGATPWGIGKPGAGRTAFREALKKNGRIVLFDELDRGTLALYIRRETRALGVTATDDAITLLIEETGDSLAVLFSALEQAALYSPGKRLDTTEMKAVLTNLRGYTVFEFAAALGERDLAKALGMAEHIMKEPKGLPYHMMMLARHFRILIKVREMLRTDRTKSQMSARLGVGENLLQSEYIPQARNYPAARLSMALGIVAEFDLDVRTPRLDERRALERLVVRLCA